MNDQTQGTVYFEEAAERMRLRIRSDGQGRPPDVALTLKTIEARFVDPAFGFNELKRLTSMSAASLRRFQRELGCTPAGYLKRCRLAMAEMALAATSEDELTVEEVARRTGYANGRSFARAFQQQAGHVPSRRRRPADPREILPAPALAGERAVPFRQVVTGELGKAAGHEVVRRLRIELCAGSRPLPEEDRIDLSYPGDPHARLVAESLWTVARDLPPRQRRALLCDAVRFRSPAMFELLSEVGREASTRGVHGEGVALAELALDVVEEHGAGFGDELHDLRALAWARIGEARLGARDLAGAELAFRFADEAWHTPRARPDDDAELEIRWLESSLRLARHRFDDACELVDATIGRLRALGRDPELLARALTRRSLAARQRGGEPEAAAAMLREAEAVVDENAHPTLALVILLHLAEAALEAGDSAEVGRLLPRARALGRRVGDGFVQVRLIHVEALAHWQKGHYAQAEQLMLAARAGFLDRGEVASAALVSIDLAKLHDRRHDEVRVREAIAETVPLVESLAVHPRSMAALRQLRAVQGGGAEPSPELLERIRTSIATLDQVPETKERRAS